MEEPSGCQSRAGSSHLQPIQRKHWDSAFVVVVMAAMVVVVVTVV